MSKEEKSQLIVRLLQNISEDTFTKVFTLDFDPEYFMIIVENYVTFFDEKNKGETNETDYIFAFKFFERLL